MEQTNILNEITPETTIGPMLDKFPQLEEVLIDLAPAFSKLKNPILRKTIARVTSLRQAAVVGQVPISKLINTLREAAGLKSAENFDKEIWQHEEPGVEMPAPVETYDARQDLESGVHPGAKVVTAASKLSPGQVYLLITPFVPAPLIDKLTVKGFLIKSRQAAEREFETYIQSPLN